MTELSTRTPSPTASDLSRIDRIMAWKGMIWLYSTGIVFPAILFARRYSLRGRTTTLADLGRLSGFGTAEYVGFIAGITAMFACYVLGLYHCRDRPAATWRFPVLTASAIAASAFALMYPVNAIDLFLYAIRSRLWTAFGLDPIAVPPTMVAPDPWLHYHGEWAGSVSPYGPLWNLIAAPGTLVAGDHLWIALAYFKLLAMLSYLTIGLIALRVTAGQGHPWSAVVWLWNPLVLWEGIGNGHNDIVMLLPIAFAIWAWSARRDRFVIPLIVVAIAIKYVAVLILPIALIALTRRQSSHLARVRVLGWSLAGSAVVLGVALWPFYDLGAIHRSIAAQSALMVTSPASLLANSFRHRSDAAEVAEGIRRAATAALLAIGMGLAWATYRFPERWTRWAFEMLFGYLMIAAWGFRSWYLIWIVALAAFLPLSLATARTVAWTIGAMAAYVVFIWVWSWWDTEYFTIERIAVPLMFTAPLLLTLWEIGAWIRLYERRPRLDE